MLDKLSDEQLDKYVRRIKGAKQDIMAQHYAMRNTCGQMRECYKMVISHKVSMLAQMIGEHWRLSCQEIGSLEKPVLEEGILEGCLPEAIVPTLESRPSGK